MHIPFEGYQIHVHTLYELLAKYSRHTENHKVLLKIKWLLHVYS